MNKKEVGVWNERGFARFLLVWAVLFAIVFLSFTTGLGVVTVSPSVGVNNVTGPITENVNWSINITVNNTALDAAIDSNITQVNITLPSSFTFLNGTNATNISWGGTGQPTFLNQSSAVVTLPPWAGTILSWNATLTPGAGAQGLLKNGTLGNFLFLFNASTPGNYNITVTTMNLSGFQNLTNISVTVNDTTKPNSVAFQGLTPGNNSFLAGNETNNASLFINISAFDNGAVQAVFFQLNNLSTLNASNITQISTFSGETRLQINASFNFSNLSDGKYFVNVTVNDTYNNFNSSIIRTFTIDNLAPSANYSLGTDANGSFLPRNFTLVNITIIELNFNVTNVSLMNASSFILQSNLSVGNITATNSSLYLNFTQLADGVYFVNVTVNDSAGHVNMSLLTRTFIVDTTFPVSSYGQQSDGNNSFVNRPFILMNISVVDANFNFTNVSLNNASGNLNQTALNRTISQLINFTALLDGVYFVNVTVNDSANNFNSTLFHRTVTVDTTNPVPNISMGSDINGTHLARNFTIVNLTVIDANYNFTNITVVNLSGSIIASNLSYNGTFGISWTGVNTTFAVLYVNFTNLADGVYFVNATVNDSAGNINRSTIRTITIDTTLPVPSYGTTSDGNGTFVARNFIIVNASVTETNLNTTNVTLHNSTGGANYSNITSFNSTNPTYINFTNLLDGVYFVNVTTNDTAGNRNSTLQTRTITVDTVNPAASYGTGTEANNSFVARNNIVVNISTTDTNRNSTNITLYNASGTAVRSNVSYNSTSPSFYVNFTGLSDGTYFFNVTVNDSAGNLNMSLPTRTITVEAASLSVSIGESTSTDASVSSTVTITGGSATVVNGTCTTNRGSVSGTGGSQTLSESSLSCSTTYTYTVTCLDQAGNSAGATKDLTTNGCGSTGGSSGGGGSSSTTPRTTTPSFTTVQTISEAQVTVGVTSSLSTNQRASVTISGESHSVGVVSVDAAAGQATIEVASTPVRATLKIGQTQQFNVNNDSYYDLNVTLNGINAGKVNVTILKVYESVPSAVPPVLAPPAGSEAPSALGSGSQAPVAPQGSAQKSSVLNTYTYLIIAIVVVLVIVLVVQRRRRLR